MKAYFLDVAQGDSTLVITSDKKSILVDCNYSDNEFIDKIKSILKENELNPDVIDAFFITHPHEDHIKGVGLINECFLVNAIYESGHRLYVSDDEKPKHYNDMLTLIKKVKATAGHYKLKAYQEIRIGTAEIKVFSPTKAFLSEERPTERDIHDQCLVFRLEDDNTSIMFTGDSSMESWRDHIVKYYSDINGRPNILKSDVLSASHHGSNTFFFPTAKNFGDPYTTGVEKIAPDITIISAGKANRHGHPDLKALSIYKNNSETEDSVFQTKHLGTIILETSKGSYSTMTEYMQEAIGGPASEAKVEIISEPKAHPLVPYKLNTDIKFTANIINKPRDVGDLVYKWTVQNNSIKPFRNHEMYEGQKGHSPIYKNQTAYHGIHILLCEVRTTTGKRICSKHIEVKVTK